VLTLMKPANVAAFAGSGPVLVQGGAGLTLLNANQLADGRPLILGDGDAPATLTLNAAEGIASLTLQGGQATGTGVLTVDGTVTCLASSAGSQTQSLVVKGSNFGIREWTIEDGPAVEDLIVQGALSNPAGLSVTLVKKGPGLLTVGDATLPGITVQDGTVRGTDFTQNVV